VGRDFDQIKTCLVSHLHGPCGRHDADIIAISANQADFSRADFVIDARAGVALRRRVVRSAGYWFSPCFVSKI